MLVLSHRDGAHLVQVSRKITLGQLPVQLEVLPHSNLSPNQFDQFDNVTLAASCGKFGGDFMFVDEVDGLFRLFVRMAPIWTPLSHFHPYPYCKGILFVCIWFHGLRTPPSSW